ncbi:MAG: hypothetical protein ACOZNI_16545 [Myxococcota bacterium]
MPAPVPFLLPGLLACADWPRFAHLPDDGREALAAGEEPPADDTVTWTELGTREDRYDDDPRDLPAEDLEVLAVDEGNALHGRATGSGWDFEATAERPADCGSPSGFPSEAEGDYVGDVDWRVVTVSEPGALCSELVYADGETRGDVLLYTLDACGIPDEPVRDADGDVVGFGDEDARNRWWVEVAEPATFGVVAAAWAPDDETRALRYLWGLSLVQPPLEGKEARCPTPDGEP